MKHFKKITKPFLSLIIILILFTSCEQDTLFEVAPVIEINDIEVTVPVQQKVSARSIEVEGPLCITRTFDYNKDVGSLGGEYNYVYADNKLVSESYTGFFSSGEYTTNYIYTYSGDLITSIVIEHFGGTENILTFTYDDEGRVLTWHNDSNLTFTYEYEGLEVRRYNGDNVLVSLQVYDTDGNLLNEDWFNLEGEYTNNRVYTYDETGNIPFKNVATWFPIGRHKYGGTLNINSISNTASSDMDISSSTTYNSDGFPTYIEHNIGNGEIHFEYLEYN